jgi:hypothetical protein
MRDVGCHAPLRGPGPGWRLGLGAAICVLAGSHLLRAAWHAWPPDWDHALHLARALGCADRLAAGDWRALPFVAGEYPPLAHCAAGLLHLTLGRSHLVAVAFTQAVLAAVALGTAAVGARLGWPLAGVAGALVVLAYDKVLFESWGFMLDLPLTAVVTATVWALLRTDGFTRPGWTLVLGVLGGAGLLTKWMYPVFVGPVVLLIGLGPRPWAAGWHRWRFALGAALVAALLAAPWYLAHPRLFGWLLRSGFTTGAAEGDPAVLTLAGLGYYLYRLPYQLGPPLAALLLVGLIRSPRGRGLTVLAAWAIPALAALTLVRNKDLRFTMPVLPALALWSVAWLERLGPRHAARAVVALALGLALHVGYFTWGWPAPEWARGRSDLDLLYPSFPPVASRWPIPELLDAVERDRAARDRRLRLAVVPDHPYLSPLTVAYYVERDRRPVRVSRAWTGPPRFLDYVLTKSDDQGPAHTTAEARALMARVAAGDPALVSLLHPVREFPLPDGERATLYRVEADPVAGVSAAALLERLSSLRPRALAGLVQAPAGLAVTVEPLTEAETRRGHLARLSLQADTVLVGDPRRPAQAVTVRDLAATLDDVRIDPGVLVAEGELELLDVRRVVIRRAAVTASDLERALVGTAPWLADPRIEATAGRLAVSGRIRGVRVAAGLVPELSGPAPVALAVWAQAIQLGPLPVPAGLVNVPLWIVNPVARLRDAGVVVELPQLVLDGGVVRLSTP